jgi:hypothetical protein
MDRVSSRISQRPGILLKTAGALAALTAAVHAFVGGYDTLVPMLGAGLPAPVEGGLHASWHMVSALLAWSAVVFWRAAGGAARHFAGLWIVSGVIFVVVGLTQSGPGGLLVNPQWVLLLPTGALAWIGGGKIGGGKADVGSVSVRED